MAKLPAVLLRRLLKRRQRPGCGARARTPAGQPVWRPALPSKLALLTLRRDRGLGRGWG
jgi:hypothetical protein